MTRGRGYAAAAAVVGAGAALLAVSRGWFAATGRVQQDSFATATDRVTGAERYPWLWALALVALAGGGAILATRGLVRVVVGWLLVVTGAGLVLGGALSVAHEAAPFWPIVAMLGGVAVSDAGWLTVHKGRSWATMGTRYERTAREPSMWDELDHGRDPTA